MPRHEEPNIENLKQYLLGNLSAPEMEAIDRQIIADEDSEENLLWAESELIEDYLDDALPTADARLFEVKFLVSAERRAQLEQISALRIYARNAARRETPAKAVEPPPNGFFDRLKIFWSLNWRPATAVFALAVVGLLFAAFYLTADKRTASEKEFAALNRNNLSDLTELKPLANLSLTSGVYRDAGDARRLNKNALTEKILFRLALPFTPAATDKFRAELLKDGKVIFTLDGVSFYSNPNGQETRLLLPSTVLEKGNYQIKLMKQTADESGFVYGFAVE